MEQVCICAEQPLRYVDPNGLAEVPGWNDLDKKLRDDLAQRLGKDAAKIWNGWSNKQRQTVLNVRAVLIDEGSGEMLQLFLSATLPSR